MYLNEKSTLIYDGKFIDGKKLRDWIETMKYVIFQSLADATQPVAIALDRSPELIVTMFALLELNIPFVPIDAQQPKRRLHNMLERAGVEYIVVYKDCRLDLPKCKKIYYRSSMIKEKKNVRAIHDNDIAYIIFTSGSTGIPKAVEVTRKGLSNFIDGITEIIDFRERKTILSLTAYTFDIFLLESVLALSKGLRVVLATEDERKNPKKIEELIVRHRVDMLQMTPSTMRLLYLYNRELKYLKNLKEIMIGGENFPRRLLEILQNLTNAKIYNMYGPTETTIWSTVADLTVEDKVHIGIPIKNTKIHIMNSKMELVKHGECGEICIEGIGLAKGYRADYEQTKKVFVYLKDGRRVYKTGDYGFINDCGKLICLGREDNQVKILGHRIELEDIDSNLREYSRILDCVTCFSGDEKNTLLSFYISDEEIQKEVIVKFLKDRIPEYMIPSHFIKISNFIYNANGKLDRKAMMKKYYQVTEGRHVKQVVIEETNYIESVINIIVGCVGGIQKNLNRTTHIEELEFDSLSYITMIVEMEDAFEIEFDTECLSRAFFRTIGEIEDYIRKKRDMDGEKIYG